VRRALEAEVLGVAQSTVHFEARDEVLSTPRAVLGRSREGQRPAEPPRVAELPRFAGQILYGDDVLGDVPTLERAREDELELEFSLALFPADRDRLRMVGFDVVADDFLEHFVGTVDVFVFDVQDRVDRVLVPERAEAVLPAKPGEQRPLIERVLRV
jgi:hypothetical protein